MSMLFISAPLVVKSSCDLSATIDPLLPTALADQLRRTDGVHQIAIPLGVIHGFGVLKKCYSNKQARMQTKTSTLAPASAVNSSGKLCFPGKGERISFQSCSLGPSSGAPPIAKIRFALTSGTMSLCADRTTLYAPNIAPFHRTILPQESGNYLDSLIVTWSFLPTAIRAKSVDECALVLYIGG